MPDPITKPDYFSVKPVSSLGYTSGEYHVFRSRDGYLFYYQERRHAYDTIPPSPRKTDRFISIRDIVSLKIETVVLEHDREMFYGRLTFQTTEGKQIYLLKESSFLHSHLAF